MELKISNNKKCYSDRQSYGCSSRKKISVSYTRYQSLIVVRKFQIVILETFQGLQLQLEIMRHSFGYHLREILVCGEKMMPAAFSIDVKENLDMFISSLQGTIIVLVSRSSLAEFNAPLTLYSALPR